MAVLVDPPIWPARGLLWSHLASDTSYEELHVFARRLAIPERAFERDHYDIPAHLYPQALGCGAEPVSSQELVRRLAAAGLRRRRRG
jgi:hypothetical protein